MSLKSSQRARPVEARVALIGAGSIGPRYVESLRHTPDFSVISVCSRNPANAERFASENRLSARSLGQILADPDINYILNLTPASEHATITTACLQAGKSVYSEKPLADQLDEADDLIGLAAARGLLLACAPATFLWPPLATAGRLVRDGRLGSIVGALSTLVYQGPEIFHPNPGHLYSAAAGPLRDMGVYQITALMALLGPVTRVSASASRSIKQRTILVGQDSGQSFAVHADTHFHAQLLHSNGAISSMIVSFDGISPRPPQFDLFGTEAGLSVESPHTPAGRLIVKNKNGQKDVIIAEPAWTEANWAIGPVAAWNTHHAGELIETSAQRARDVLEVLIAIETAAASNAVISVTPSAVWA